MSPNLLHQEESANNGQALAMSALIEGTSDAEDIWEFYNNTAECLKDENPCLPINATPQAPSSDLTPRQIGHQKRVETLKRNKQLQHEQQRKTEALAQAQQEAESLKQAEALQAHRMAALERILAGLTLDLNANYLDFGDLLVYAFDPSRSGLGRWRSEQFWRRPESFWALMRHWLAARATGSGSKLVKAFSLDLVTRLFRHEARGITIDGCLKSMLGDAPVQATAFELFKANPQDMQVSDLTERFDKAPPLTLEDLQLSPEEAGLHRKCVVYTILDIIVNHGGIEFEKYRPLLARQLLTLTHKREIHQDHIYPFPTMHIDESTVKGNIEICSALFKELGFDTSKPEFQKLVHLLAGDQLTIARLRAIAKNRMGHESGYESFEWLAQIIGLFHLKMAQTQGVLETHMGDSNSSRNPTSLAFQQTLLHRKPLPTPVPFRTA
ncbi:hypothetical protein FRC06_007311 [Ceratobasidium sp. 370]|nr:hypothetical protein FRC06_007311 [Ceratobasidium sp. 370]